MKLVTVLKNHYCFRWKAFRDNDNYLIKILLLSFAFVCSISSFLFLRTLIEFSTEKRVNELFLSTLGYLMVTRILSINTIFTFTPYLKLPIKSLSIIILWVIDNILLDKKILFIALLGAVLLFENSCLILLNFYLFLFVFSLLGITVSTIERSVIHKILLIASSSFLYGLGVYYFSIELFSLMLVLTTIILLFTISRIISNSQLFKIN